MNACLRLREKLRYTVRHRTDLFRHGSNSCKTSFPMLIGHTRPASSSHGDSALTRQCSKQEIITRDGIRKSSCSLSTTEGSPRSPCAYQLHRNIIAKEGRAALADRSTAKLCQILRCRSMRHRSPQQSLPETHQRQASRKSLNNESPTPPGANDKGTSLLSTAPRASSQRPISPRPWLPRPSGLGFRAT